jgi:hypothetical protein
MKPIEISLKKASNKYYIETIFENSGVYKTDFYPEKMATALFNLIVKESKKGSVFEFIRDGLLK